METYYIGADVHCNNTELAIERRGRVFQRYSIPTDIRSIRQVLNGLGGKQFRRMGESAFLSPMPYFSCFANKQSIHFLLHLRKIGFRISARFDIFMIRQPRPVRKFFHQFMLYRVIMDIIHMTL